MTPRDLSPQLAAYAAGLDAELTLLRQIQDLASAQREASDRHDIERLNQIADERDRLMAGLVRIEHDIRAVRQLLAEHRAAASLLPAYHEVVMRHRQAAALVSEIIASDKETIASLRDAEAARRTAAQTIEAGEHTLAAYRRVISPVRSAPSLVDRRG